MRPRLKTALAAAILFALNLWVVKELLTAEYIDQMYSIEGTVLAAGRFALEHFPDLRWFPLWYGGVPYQNTYQPLLSLTVAAAAKLFGLTPALAYHAVCAVFYSLGPVTLFLLAWRLSKSRAYSFAAGVAYSLISPSAFLIRIVREDMGSVWRARRLEALLHYGEGPHIAAMTLLPAALLLLVIAFEKRRPVWWFLAAAGMAAVALTNWIGAFVLVFAIPAWLIANDERFDGRHWLSVGAAGVYAYLLSCSWIPPSTIATVRRNEMIMGVRTAPAWQQLVFVTLAAAVLVAIFRLFRRFRPPLALRFSVLFLFPMAWLTLACEWFGVVVLPQGRRCHLEMEMGIVLAATFGARLILDSMRPRVRTAIVCVLVLAAIGPAVKYRRYAKRLDRGIDIRRTIEFREAQWFATHMQGRRVFAPGSVGFFLNAFTDVPQFAGGFYQGVVNPLYHHFNYQITSSENAGKADGEVAAIGLKAFGVAAVGVSGPRSGEIFKPFVNPKKFDGLLPEAWRDGDDVIYLIPARSSSLAHVVRPEDLPSRRPLHGADVDPLRAYVRALDDPSLPLAPMEWRNPYEAVITAAVARDQVLSVQMSYDPGWSATVQGVRRRIFGDNLGQLVIEPACAGPCTVMLSYDGGLEMLAARIVSWSALAGGLGYLLADWLRRRYRPGSRRESMRVETPL
jgi:hypothetical protein